MSNFASFALSFKLFHRSLLVVLCAVCYASCQKAEQSEASCEQAKEYSIAQLLSEETLREHVSLGSLEVLTCTIEEGQSGVRYEWSLDSPEFIQETNKERARLSLLNGKAPELIPSSARISLNKRSCEMNLVELRNRLSQHSSHSSNDVAQALRVGSSSGLWCPAGRVLHFDTPSGQLSLGVELGRGVSRDYELAIELASAILTRSENGFFASEQQISPAAESWIDPQ